MAERLAGAAEKRKNPRGGRMGEAGTGTHGAGGEENKRKKRKNGGRKRRKKKSERWRERWVVVWISYEGKQHVFHTKQNVFNTMQNVFHTKQNVFYYFCRLRRRPSLDWSKRERMQS